ncbi:hypothetical protein AGR7B_Lc100052 [Agrobacterium deltaense RV3]|nr:hypothetical protein AGR7B_Lc100052 [Agrobacterium deltaense RV3]
MVELSSSEVNLSSCITPRVDLYRDTCEKPKPQMFQGQEVHAFPQTL